MGAVGAARTVRSVPGSMEKTSIQAAITGTIMLLLFLTAAASPSTYSCASARPMDGSTSGIEDAQGTLEDENLPYPLPARRGAAPPQACDASAPSDFASLDPLLTASAGTLHHSLSGGGATCTAPPCKTPGAAAATVCPQPSEHWLEMLVAAAAPQPLDTLLPGPPAALAAPVCDTDARCTATGVAARVGTPGAPAAATCIWWNEATAQPYRTTLLHNPNAQPYCTTLLHNTTAQPYNTTLLHTIPYHTISYHAMPCHTVPYHTMPYLTIPYHAIPCHTIPYHIIPYLTSPHCTYPR